MFLGIEIGGTKLQLGVGPGDGTIVAIERARVDASAGAERIRQQIIDLVPILLSQSGLSRADIRAVGIGFGGPVDAERGIVTKSHQVEGWAGFPLADWSRRELGWPTVVHNDADTAGLAEACFGAGRGYNPIFYITIGSGIGGGLIIDQKIYRGAGVGAAEIGHMLVPRPKDLLAALIPVHDCDVQFPSTLESLCSGWGLARRVSQSVSCWLALEGLRDRPNQSPAVSELLSRPVADAHRLKELARGNENDISAEHVATAACEGNELASRHLRATARILAWAVAQVITLVCPRRVVIGGGVSMMDEDLLLAPLRADVARYAFGPFANCFEIVPAALGEAVVVHGALRLARESAGIDR